MQHLKAWGLNFQLLDKKTTKSIQATLSTSSFEQFQPFETTQTQEVADQDAKAAKEISWESLSAWSPENSDWSTLMAEAMVSIKNWLSEISSEPSRTLLEMYCWVRNTEKDFIYLSLSYLFIYIE